MTGFQRVKVVCKTHAWNFKLVFIPHELTVRQTKTIRTECKLWRQRLVNSIRNDPSSHFQNVCKECPLQLTSCLPGTASRATGTVLGKRTVKPCRESRVAKLYQWAWGRYLIPGRGTTKLNPSKRCLQPHPGTTGGPRSSSKWEMNIMSGEDSKQGSQGLLQQHRGSSTAELVGDFWFNLLSLTSESS